MTAVSFSSWTFGAREACYVKKGTSAHTASLPMAASSLLPGWTVSIPGSMKTAVISQGGSPQLWQAHAPAYYSHHLHHGSWVISGRYLNCGVCMAPPLILLSTVNSSAYFLVLVPTSHLPTTGKVPSQPPTPLRQPLPSSSTRISRYLG